MERIGWEVWREVGWEAMDLVPVLVLEMDMDMALVREIELRNDYHMHF
jgi:hypothetical protein